MKGRSVETVAPVYGARMNIPCEYTTSVPDTIQCAGLKFILQSDTTPVYQTRMDIPTGHNTSVLN